MSEQNKYAVPLYAARLEHLTWALSVTARCACGHVAEVTVEVLWRRLPLSTKINDSACSLGEGWAARNLGNVGLK